MRDRMYVNWLHVRLRPRMREALQAHAERAGVSTSEVVRAKLAELLQINGQDNVNAGADDKHAEPARG